MRRFAVLLASREADAEDQARLHALLGGLQQLGWSDGGNFRIDIQWAGGSPKGPRRLSQSS
jgi:hypothetical protein